MTPIDLTGSGLDAESEITWLARHLPTNDEADAELWALGVTGSSSSTLARKDTTWHGVTVDDAIDLTSGTQYGIDSRSFHGKLFLAYKSSVDRLHVWDGTSLRRVGLPVPSAAPTAANSGSGSLTGTRYYRVRFTVQNDDGQTLRRSEPSDVLTFAPSGTGASIIITAPSATDAESPSHWELEASTDNANFYRLATTAIATTTVTDIAAYVPGYGDFTLSEEIADYTPPASCEFLSVDQDRLLFGGSYNDPALASRVSWTPVNGDPGVGNDERVPIDSDNFVDLDAQEGGGLTGLSDPVGGFPYGFKQRAIYRLVRTGDRSRAYDVICLTKQRGALKGSITDGVDQAGRPCLYFLDPFIGPCRMGANGLQTCGGDIFATWKSEIHRAATFIVARTIFYPEARQVHWWIATGDSNVPNLEIVLQTDAMRDADDGTHGGFSLWTGQHAAARAVCLYADNLDTGDPRSQTLRPVMAVPTDSAGAIHLTDTGDDDSGTPFTATITTKPYLMGGLLNRFGILAGSIFAKAAEGVSLLLTAIRDFGIETKSVDLDLSPTASEAHVIRQADDLAFGELYAVQFALTDGATGGRWEANQIALKLRAEQSA